MNPRGTALTLRLIGGVAVLATLAAIITFLQVVAATTPALVIGGGIFVVVGAIAVGLFGIATLLEQGVATRADFMRAVGRLDEQRADVADLPRSPAPAPVDLSNIEYQIEQLHELVLLSDRERADLRVSRLVTLAVEFVAARAWREADQAVRSAELLSPGEPSVIAARRSLEQSRAEAEALAVAAAQRDVESEMSRGAWESAESQAVTLTENYPGNAVAQSILQRVRRERQIFTESATQRLYDEIRKASERRQWRQALERAQELIEKFPAHEKAERVRAQLLTLQENAEIEERHAIESQIADLVKSRRFADAIVVGEDLLRRFPTSPQVAKFQQLLPRLRELAAEN